MPRVRERHVLGWWAGTDAEFQSILYQMQKDWLGSKYRLVSRRVTSPGCRDLPRRRVVPVFAAFRLLLDGLASLSQELQPLCGRSAPAASRVR